MAGGAVLEKQQRPAQAHPAHPLYEGGELQVASPAIEASRARHCPQRLHCTRRVSMVLTASASRRGHPTFRAHQVRKQDIVTRIQVFRASARRVKMPRRFCLAHGCGNLLLLVHHFGGNPKVTVQRTTLYTANRRIRAVLTALTICNRTALTFAALNC